MWPLHGVAVLQCVAVCCSVLQCVACALYQSHAWIFFSQNSTIITSSFAERDLQFEVSYGFLPPCKRCRKVVGPIYPTHTWWKGPYIPIPYVMERALYTHPIRDGKGPIYPSHTWWKGPYIPIPYVMERALYTHPIRDGKGPIYPSHTWWKEPYIHEPYRMIERVLRMSSTHDERISWCQQSDASDAAKSWALYIRVPHMAERALYIYTSLSPIYTSRIHGRKGPIYIYESYIWWKGYETYKVIKSILRMGTVTSAIR